MNKRANRKAFFILLCVGILYMSIAFDFTDRFSMRRTREARAGVTHQGFAVSIPDSAAKRVDPVLSVDSPAIEPALLISLPLIASAIKDGLLDKDGLILVKRDNDGRADFKRLFELLRDKDEEGLRSVGAMVGKKQLVHLLKRDGIEVGDRLEAGEIMTGKGYVVERATLIAFYNHRVGGEYENLLPVSGGDYAMSRGDKGFEIGPAAPGGIKSHSRVKMEKTASTDTGNGGKTEEQNSVPPVRPVSRVIPRGLQGQTVAPAEWAMPNLTNLPMRTALEKVVVHTAKIRVYGSGFVTDQKPKPYENVKGEVECAIYGRSYKQ